MAYGRLATMEIHELIRLARAGENTSTIARVLRINRRTAIRYRAWAGEQGVLTGTLPDPGRLQRLIATTLPVILPPQQTSTVAAYGDEITHMRERGMEIAAIRSRPEFFASWRLRVGLRGQMIRMAYPDLS